MWQKGREKSLCPIWRGFSVELVRNDAADKPSVAHDDADVMAIRGLKLAKVGLASRLPFRAVRQPPCPSSRAAASLGAIAEPWATPEVPRLLARPRGFQAPWGFPRLFEKPGLSTYARRLPHRPVRGRRWDAAYPRAGFRALRLRTSAAPIAVLSRLRRLLVPCLARGGTVFPLQPAHLPQQRRTRRRFIAYLAPSMRFCLPSCRRSIASSPVATVA